MKLTIVQSVIVACLAYCVEGCCKKHQGSERTVSGVTTITPKPQYVENAENLLRTVQSRITAEALLDWARPWLDEHEKSTDIIFIPIDRIPATLRTVDPTQLPRVVILPHHSGPGRIVFDWGGGFGHSGLEIGRPQYFPNNPNEFYIKWVPGVYVFHSNK